MNYNAVREQVHKTTLKADQVGLIYLSSGNISTRTSDGNVAITPSNVKYDVLKAHDIAVIDVEHNHIDGPYPASSEVPMHTYVYRNMPEVGGIVHTHSSYAITFASFDKEIPIANIDIFLCGGAIPVAPWACPGTEKAGQQAVDLLKQRPGLQVVLLHNHGLLAIGETLEAAFDAAYHAERGMMAYHLALQVGEPTILSDEQIQEIKDVYHL